MRLIIDNNMSKKIIKNIQQQLDEFAEDEDKLTTGVPIFFQDLSVSRRPYVRAQPWCLMVVVERPKRIIEGPDITDKFNGSYIESYGRYTLDEVGRGE